MAVGGDNDGRLNSGVFCTVGRYHGGHSCSNSHSKRLFDQRRTGMISAVSVACAWIKGQTLRANGETSRSDILRTTFASLASSEPAQGCLSFGRRVRLGTAGSISCGPARTARR